MERQYLHDDLIGAEAQAATSRLIRTWGACLRNLAAAYHTPRHAEGPLNISIFFRFTVSDDYKYLLSGHGVCVYEHCGFCSEYANLEQTEE